MEINTVPSFYKEQFSYLQRSSLKVQFDTKTPDRALIKIGYCNKTFQWEVIFCGSQPAILPDFIFHEEEEFFTKIDCVSSLKKWNANNPGGLLSIITELIGLYKEYQKKLIKNYPSQRMQFEFGTIAEIEGVEYLIDKEQLEFHCLVPIPLNFQNVEKSSLKLFLVFSLTSDKIPDRRLVFESKSIWENLLLSVKLPIWTSDMYTVTYLHAVQELVSSYYGDLSQRKKLIEAFQLLFGTPLEYDGYNFQKIAFVFDTANFTFIVHISIPMDFPSKQPSVTLSSTSQIKNNKPIQLIYNSYPYSPRWNTDELVKRIRDFILEALTEFKKYCNDEADIF